MSFFAPFSNQERIRASLMSIENSVTSCLILPALATLKRACVAPLSVGSTWSSIACCWLGSMLINRSNMSLVIQSICSSFLTVFDFCSGFFGFGVTSQNGTAPIACQSAQQRTPKPRATFRVVLPIRSTHLAADKKFISYLSTS